MMVHPDGEQLTLVNVFALETIRTSCLSKYVLTSQVFPANWI